jgi:hypothetical protein
MVSGCHMEYTQPAPARGTALIWKSEGHTVIRVPGQDATRTSVAVPLARTVAAAPTARSASLINPTCTSEIAQDGPGDAEEQRRARSRPLQRRRARCVPPHVVRQAQQRARCARLEVAACRRSGAHARGTGFAAAWLCACCCAGTREPPLPATWTAPCWVTTVSGRGEAQRCGLARVARIEGCNRKGFGSRSVAALARLARCLRTQPQTASVGTRPSTRASSPDSNISATTRNAHNRLRPAAPGHQPGDREVVPRGRADQRPLGHGGRRRHPVHRPRGPAQVLGGRR